MCTFPLPMHGGWGYLSNCPSRGFTNRHPEAFGHKSTLAFCHRPNVGRNSTRTPVRPVEERAFPKRYTSWLRAGLRTTRLDLSLLANGGLGGRCPSWSPFS